MDLTAIKDSITVCKVSDISEIDMTKDFSFWPKLMMKYLLYAKRSRPLKIV